MLTITLALLICQHIGTSWSTRLPLEVYELTPVLAAAATGSTATTTTSATTTSHINRSTATVLDFNQTVKHKNLQYSIVDAKMLEDSSAPAATPTPPATAPLELYLHEQQSNQPQQQLDRRRSRKMLDILQQQQQQQVQLHQIQHQHRYKLDALHLQKKQPAQFLHHEKDNANSNNLKAHLKDVRVLYQVGDSEDDLPICAPNAVCSKIDLYETPWIERQCRCPDSNRQPPTVVIHHHHALNSNNINNRENLMTELSGSSTSHADRYRNYFEKEKLLQHKRLLVSDFTDKKFESLHLKKLMQKLGAVYEDDLQLHPSDYIEHDENDAVRSAEDLEEISDNEFPHGPPHRPTTGARLGTSTTHMRHSGHLGHKAKELISVIGGCPSGLGIEDGHTIADKTRHYKMCQPVHKLPVCRHFRDFTWTLTTSAELNVTEQIVHCRCPKNSVTYLTKREPATDGLNGYMYLFACSPLTRIRCQRKQPCKLFTVRKRQEFLDEVNINALCQCPKGHQCPSHHTQSGVIAGESFLEDNIQTYSGYCMAND